MTSSIEPTISITSANNLRRRSKRTDATATAASTGDSLISTAQEPNSQTGMAKVAIPKTISGTAIAGLSWNEQVSTPPISKTATKK